MTRFKKVQKNFIGDVVFMKKTLKRKNAKKCNHQEKDTTISLKNAVVVLIGLFVACLIGGSSVFSVVLCLAVKSTIAILYALLTGDKKASKREILNFKFNISLAIPLVGVSMFYPEIDAFRKFFVLTVSILSCIFYFSKDKTLSNFLELLFSPILFILNYLHLSNLLKKAFAPAIAKIIVKVTEVKKHENNKYVIYLKINLEDLLFFVVYGAICLIPLLDYTNILNRSSTGLTSEFEIMLNTHIFRAMAIGIFLFWLLQIPGIVQFFIILFRMMKDDINKTKNRIVTIQRIPNTKDESKVIMCNFKRREDNKMDILKLKQNLSRLGDVTIVVIALTCVIANIWLKRACVVTYNYAVKVVLNAAEVCGEALCHVVLGFVLTVRYAYILETKLKVKIQAIKKTWNCKVKPVLKDLTKIAIGVACISLMIGISLDKLNVMYVCYQIAICVILTIRSELKEVKDGKGRLDLELINWILLQISIIVCVNGIIGYYPALINVHKLGKVLLTLIAIIIVSVLAIRKDKQTPIWNQSGKIDLKLLIGFVFEQRKCLLLLFGLGFPMLCCLFEFEAIIASNLASFGNPNLFAFCFLAGVCIIVGICGIIITIVAPLSLMIDCISRNKKN